MFAGNLTGGNQKPVCTICFEDLRPIAEDLQSIPICGHVFHELCIQQWMEYCPSGKKPTCPVCKQSCSASELTRLYFQSTGDQTQLSNSLRKGKEADAEELEKEVRRLGGKLTALAAVFDNQQGCIKKLNDELMSWKELAKNEEARKDELRKEKERIEQYLNVKMEELSRKTTECTKLQARSLGLAKELAALKLATDVNLGEEEMVKLASLGQANNPENAIDVLKKSLALRNKSYKELMIQCNILGRSDTRARKKLDKSKEKINRLNARLQELEKALEEKENEILRNLKLKSSYKDQTGKPMKEMTKSNNLSFSTNHSDHLKRSVNHSEAIKAPTSLASKEKNSVIDLETDSCFMDEDCLRLSPEINEHSVPDLDFQKSPVPAQGATSLTNPVDLSADQHVFLPEQPCSSGGNMKSNVNGVSERIIARKVTHITSSTWTAETLIIDDISKQTPSSAVKKEAHTNDTATCSGGLFGPEGTSRTIGKWCKSSPLKTTSISGELISVGSDGRGGRVKVLRDHDQVSDEKAKTLWPKKYKYGAKQSGQFHIEHFFKTES